MAVGIFLFLGKYDHKIVESLPWNCEAISLAIYEILLDVGTLKTILKMFKTVLFELT